MSGVIQKFYLESDEKTYWTLMLKDVSTADDICKQVRVLFALAVVVLWES